MDNFKYVTTLKVHDEDHELKYIPGEGLVVPMIYVDYISGYYEPKPHYEAYDFLIPDNILKEIKAALSVCEGDDGK